MSVGFYEFLEKTSLTKETMIYVNINHEVSSNFVSDNISSQCFLAREARDRKVFIG